MTRREKLDDAAIAAFLSARPGWERHGDRLVRTFGFATWPDAIAFVVKVGILAEVKDHHPELQVSWGKVAVGWWTHDRGGITGVDAALAELTDDAYGAGAHG